MSERRRPKGWDDEDLWPMYLGMGTAHGVAGPDDKPGRAVGGLLLPDPEQRHGWRESYVYRDDDAPVSSRTLGFRRDRR